MKKREANFQTIFNQYLRKKKLAGFFELKEAKNDSLPFSSVKEHQLSGLIAASNNGFVWKLSDEDQRQKPFDCMYAPKNPGYVVIKYSKVFCIMTAQMFEEERDISTRKSLTKARALELSTHIVFL